MAPRTKIPNEDWMKVIPADYGQDVVNALQAKTAAWEAVKASEAYKANEAANTAYEQAWAKALVDRGMLENGRKPIFSRYGDIADPSKWSEPVDGKGGSKKRTLAPAPAVLLGPDKRAKK